MSEAPKSPASGEQKRSLVRSAGKMGIATLLSRVLGLAREQVFAFFFGASDAADAFNIAFRIPNLLRDLFAEGAMSAAFVPNFTRALTESKEKAHRLLASVLFLLLAFLGIVSILGIFFSDKIVALYAGSYENIPGKFELTVRLTQVMFPFLPFVAMAAVVMGALNAMGYFFLPAFAPALFNVVSILCGVILCPLFEHYTSIPPVQGMAIGVVLGGFVQFYVQWWQAKREGFGLKQFWAAVALGPHRLVRDENVRKVIWLLIPGTVGLAATQLNILINSVFATSQGSGAVSWLNYSFRLMQFPIGIFGVSLAAAALPTVSRHLALKNSEAAASEVRHALQVTFAVNGPAAAGLMALGLPIIQLLFQHGRFGFEDSNQTASALFWYALGLPAYSAIKVLVPVFYALGTTRVPVLLSFFTVGVNASLNYGFLKVLHWPFWALAFSTSVTVGFNAALLGFFLWRKLPGFVTGQAIRSFFVHTVLSIGVFFLSSFTLAQVQALLGAVLGEGIVLWGFEVAIVMGVVILSWWSLGKAFKIEEIMQAAELFERLIVRLKGLTNRKKSGD